ncbi:MAG TPA: hypothetical protein VHK26_05175, partial [Methyloceanibacter sp.]|nr:hypothetical protein [Methyloceanibacter sp.]
MVSQADQQSDVSRAPSSISERGDDEEPKLNRKDYEKQLRKLQAELCSLQDWVKAAGERIIVVFEGR